MQPHFDAALYFPLPHYAGHHLMPAIPQPDLIAGRNAAGLQRDPKTVRAAVKQTAEQYRSIRSLYSDLPLGQCARLPAPLRRRVEFRMVEFVKTFAAKTAAAVLAIMGSVLLASRALGRRAWPKDMFSDAHSRLLFWRVCLPRWFRADPTMRVSRSLI